MGVYVKDNAGNIKKLAGYITQKQNARWFLCTRSLEDGIEYYDVPQSAEDYYKTIDAYTIYSFGFAETNTTNYPKLRYGTTILDIKDITNTKNRIEIGQLNGVYNMYTQDLVADPKMYFVGTTNLDNSSSDYKIVTAEPEDKSQGKMVYENVSSPVIPQYDSVKTTVYGSPQNLIDKYINDSENWTWDDVRNLDWLGMTQDASTNFWNYVMPLNESIYDTLYSNINNPLKLKVRINGAEQEITANFSTVSEEAGAIWTVSDEAGTYGFQIQTQPSPILYGGMSGVEGAPHIPNIVYAGTQASVEILSISSQDGTEIWKNIGKSSVFNITNLKIADGTKYNTLKYLVNEGMQEKLTAGTGITIENDVISATAQETQIDNTTITKTTDGKLQAVGLQDETDSKILTAHDIWLACSIEREV